MKLGAEIVERLLLLVHLPRGAAFSDRADDLRLQSCPDRRRLMRIMAMSPSLSMRGGAGILRWTNYSPHNIAAWPRMDRPVTLK
jgi:hypothetical protein